MCTAARRQLPGCLARGVARRESAAPGWRSVTIQRQTVGVCADASDGGRVHCVSAGQALAPGACAGAPEWKRLSPAPAPAAPIPRAPARASLQGLREEKTPARANWALDSTAAVAAHAVDAARRVRRCLSR